jgi:hypothetical protein
MPRLPLLRLIFDASSRRLFRHDTMPDIFRHFRQIISPLPILIRHFAISPPPFSPAADY